MASIPGDGNGLVHGGHEAVAGADVGQHLDVEDTCELQPPIAGTGTGAGIQAYRRVAALEIGGVQMDGLVGTDGQDQRPGAVAVVIDGADFDITGSVGVIDDPDEPLAGRIGCCGKKRYLVIRGSEMT